MSCVLPFGRVAILFAQTLAIPFPLRHFSVKSDFNESKESEHGTIVMMKRPHREAVIYAGNDPLWKVACHRDHADKSAKAIGYQKVNLKKADAIEKVLDKKHNRSMYTMIMPQRTCTDIIRMHFGTSN